MLGTRRTATAAIITTCAAILAATLPEATAAVALGANAVTAGLSLLGLAYAAATATAAATRRIFNPAELEAIDLLMTGKRTNEPGEIASLLYKADAVGSEDSTLIYYYGHPANVSTACLKKDGHVGIASAYPTPKKTIVSPSPMDVSAKSTKSTFPFLCQTEHKAAIARHKPGQAITAEPKSSL